MTVWAVRLGKIITTIASPIADIHVRLSVEMCETEYYEFISAKNERGV